MTMRQHVKNRDRRGFPYRVPKLRCNKYNDGRYSSRVPHQCVVGSAKTGPGTPLQKFLLFRAEDIQGLMVLKCADKVQWLCQWNPLRDDRDKHEHCRRMQW